MHLVILEGNPILQVITAKLNDKFGQILHTAGKIKGGDRQKQVRIGEQKGCRIFA